MKHLQRDDLPALGVIGPVDGALTARGDLFENLVTSYTLFHGTHLQAPSVAHATTRISALFVRLPYYWRARLPCLTGDLSQPDNSLIGGLAAPAAARAPAPTLPRGN